MEHTVAGTPVYMAPEIASYKAYGKRADLWSCGALFLEMLVGNRPWEGCTRREEGPRKKAFFYRFSEGEVDLSQYGVKVSEMCLDLIKRMLKQNPADRISW
jgi:serine/threonine-protein kinase ULK/ATG1